MPGSTVDVGTDRAVGQPDTSGPAPSLRIELLGGFRVAVGERAIGADAWRRRKAADLIKLLALAPGHRLHREELMELLWPELGPEAATNNLHRTLHVARRILEPGLASAQPSAFLLLRGDMLVLYPSGPLWIDVEAFVVAASGARLAGDPRTYEAALGLYTGDLLPEDRYEDWAAGRREELRATYLGLLLDLARLYEAPGACTSAIDALQRVLAADPLHEDAHVGLMRLYTATGRRREALRQFEHLRATLRRELDAEPDAASQLLYEQILTGQASPDGMRGELPDRHAAASTSLTCQLTSFVGREQEIADVRRLLAAHRLVTLTGPGGVGKSRLAMAVAASLLANHAGGVRWVELAALADPRLLPRTLASALGVREEPKRPILATLVDALGSGEMLLVLDNCEHLVAACAELAAGLLRACPRLRILTTSREVLSIGGEATWRVPSLATPEQDGLGLDRLARYDAIRLFVERAQLSRPGFTLTVENAAEVAQICRRLDGIPLAIELAAARLAALSPAQIAARLGDTLSLLTAADGTAPPRQQTLRATLDWSYGLLSEREQVLLRRLAVFAGGWTLEAAEATCAGGGIEVSEILGLLARLIAKSLVVVDDQGGEPRYRLLETVRQFGAEKLAASGEADVVRDRHRDWCLALAEEAEPALVGPEQAAWLDRLEREHDNLRAAIDRCIDRCTERGEAALALRLGGALWRFWDIRGYLHEGQRRLETALAMSRPGPGTLDQAPPPVDQVRGARSSGEAQLRARTLRGAGQLAESRGDYPRAVARYEEGLAVLRDLGDRGGVAELLDKLADVALYRRDFSRAVALYDESLSLRRALDDRRGIAESLANLGRAMSDLGDYPRATALLAESLALFREVGDRASVAHVLGNLASLAYLQCDFERALALAERCLTLRRELGDRAGIARALTTMGLNALQRGDLERAAALLEESLARWRQIDSPWGAGLALLGLGRVMRRLGDLARSAALLHEGVMLLRNLGDRRGVAGCLEGLAGVALDLGQPRTAARLFGTADAVRDAIGTPWQPVDHAEFGPDVAAARVQLGEAAFAAAWAEGRSKSVEAAIADALTIGHPDLADNREIMPQPAPLSRREREVTILVAQGLTNRQIAARLGMSERTADTHVSRILRKLGLGGRAKVAVWARDLGFPTADAR